MVKHPMQPVIVDTDRVIRFKQNAIVRWLLDAGPFDMNTIAVTPFNAEDRTQFVQLIGYSVSGAGDLDYFDRKILSLADAEAEKLIKNQARHKK